MSTAAEITAPRSTASLADASYLEDIVRGKRLLILSGGDPRPAARLASRVKGSVVVCDTDKSVLQDVARESTHADLRVVEATEAGKLPFEDGQFEAVVAWTPELHGITPLAEEARRVMTRGGLLAVALPNPGRPTLESALSGHVVSKADSPREGAQRALSGLFPYVSVIDRRPYVGYHFVANAAAADNVTLDAALVGGVEEPTGFLIVASGTQAAVMEALVQVPYDRLVNQIFDAVGEADAQFTEGVKHLRRDLVERAERAESAMTELDAVRERLFEAQEETERLRGELRAAKERMSLLDVELARLRSKAAVLSEEEMAAASEALEQAREEADDLRQRLLDAEQRAGRVEELEARAADAESLSEQLAEATEELKRVDELERELAAVRAEASDLESAESKLEELEELREKVQALEQRAEQAQKLEEEVERLTGELERAGESTEAAVPSDADLAGLNEEMEALRSQLEAADIRIAEAEAAAVEATARATAAEGQLDRYRERAETAEAQLESRETMRDEADDALRRARDAEGQLEGLESVLHQRETALSVAEEELERNAAANEQLEQQLQDAQAALKEIETELHDVEARLKTAQEEASVASEREQTAREAADELKQALAAQAAGSQPTEDAQAQVRKLETERDELRQRLEASNAEMSATQAEVQRLRSDMGALTDALESAREDTRRLRKELERRPDPADPPAAAAPALDVDTEQQLQHLRNQVSELSIRAAAATELEGRATAMSARISELEAELDAANEKLRKAGVS